MLLTCNKTWHVEQSFICFKIWVKVPEAKEKKYTLPFNLKVTISEPQRENIHVDFDELDSDIDQAF